MSLKSQKSLNDECSEIIEKSYSIRSASEESLSCDDDESLARELMNKMTPAVLSKLRRSFKKNKERSLATDIDRRVEAVMRAAAAEEGIQFAAAVPPPEDSLWLDEGGFVSALDIIFGHHKYTTHAHKLFQLLDPFRSGKVWWRQLVCRLVAVGARKTSSRADVWTRVREGPATRLDHCKRESLVKLVSIEKEDSFCYVAVSKGGRVGIYSGELQLLTSYEVFYHRSGVSKRVKNSWITDAIYFHDVQCLILSASDRSLTVYDATTLTHAPTFCITGLPSIPTCLAYSTSSITGDSELIFGTERGDLTRIRFLQPRMSLFHSKTPDNINYYFWMELTSPPHTTYCAISTWRKVHSRTVRRVAYTRDGEIVLSCSHDSTVSVRSRQVPGKLDDYVFKVQRGVTCFHVITPLHLLVTGSCDGVVRLWETTQSTPFATLAAPTLPAVLDIAVIASEEIVLAYCNNCTVHIWDMYEECLLQSIKLRFPFLGVLGKKVEFGAFCIHPGPARKEFCDDDLPSIPPLEAPLSRRGSSVYQGSTGGLILQKEPQEDWLSRGLEQEPEYIRFNRPELLLTCCDYVCLILLKDDELGSVLPPPRDTLRARRPSIWELPADMLSAQGLSRRPSPRSPTPSPRLLMPSAAEYPTHDLDTLLKNAGLEGILEKDFVLMQGLKQDLNRKLAEMDDKRNEMSSAVSAGAPYLAIKTYEPVPMAPVDDMMDKYKRVMRLFPGMSVTATPNGSENSTPRRSSKL